MEALVTFILGKLGIAVSGPIGWAASLIIDKVIGYVITLIKDLAVAAKDKYQNSTAINDEAQKGDVYKGTLKDGVNEQSQIDASIDAINSGRSND